MKNKIMVVWDFIKGYKTYALGACLTVAGIYTKNNDMVIVGLTMITGRSAVATEIDRIILALKSSNAPAASSSTVSGQ